jgi:hypothetical protein
MGKKLTIDLGDLKLSADEHNALVGAVHSAVVSHLAKSTNASVHSAAKHLHDMGMGLVASAPKPAKAPKAAAKKAKA